MLSQSDSNEQYLSKSTLCWMRFKVDNLENYIDSFE